MNHRHIRASGSFHSGDFDYEIFEVRGGRNLDSHNIDSRLKAGKWLTFDELKDEIRNICEETGWVCKATSIREFSEFVLEFYNNNIYLYARVIPHLSPYSVRTITDELNPFLDSLR